MFVVIWIVNCVLLEEAENRQTKIYKFRSLEYWCTGKDLHCVDDVRGWTTSPFTVLK